MKQEFRLSENFIEEIFRISGGYLQNKELDAFFSLLELEAGKYLFTKSSENNLLRIVNSFFYRGMFLKDAVKYPHYIELLVTISANSNYLCDILVRDPEFFYWIANPSNLFAEVSEDFFSKAAKDITQKYRSFTSKLNALKSLKRKELLRIGLKDLLGTSSVEETTGHLSSLAVSILDTLLKLCIKETEKKYNVKIPASYCLISLGKLGGRELNYSSDTDLMLFYDKDRKLGNRYYSEYIIETIKLFIDSASRPTDNGYLYRIDLRLRPDGRNSVLCRSLNDYLNYYESKGASWERQMLIKSDFVSGDLNLFNRFITYLGPFIYPATQTTSPGEQIHKLKSEIERNLKSELNIKLTKGGIRDIEFIVQVLQLLYGGKIKEIREQNTLKSIEKLAALDLVKEDEKNILSGSYIFYRRIEHYLQLMNDQQTHTIPGAGEIVDKMACFLGYPDRKDFLADLNNLRKTVREIYKSFIPVEEEENNFNLLFKNKSQSLRDLEYLKKGTELTGGKTFDQATQNAFNDLEPLLYDLLKNIPDPDLVIRNFSSVIRNSIFPSIWYKQLQDETLMDYFLQTSSFSERAVKMMVSEPSLQDFFLSRRIFIDYKRNDLFQFPLKRFLFYLYTNFSIKKLKHNEVSELLSGYCSSKISSLCNKLPGRKNYFVAAMGSFGSCEMTFSSDLDLVFIVRQTSSDTEKKFRELLAGINRELPFFKADCRLRPEGERGQLVWELKSYQNYLTSRARIWELQALCRLQLISGDKEMFEDLVQSVNERIKKENCENVKKSVLEMRAKTREGLSGYSKTFYFKKSPGGMIDVEYLLQFLILCNPGFYTKCRGKNIPGTAQELMVLDEYKELKTVTDNYDFLKMLEMTIQNVLDTDKAAYPSDKEKKNLIAAFLNMKYDELESMMKEKINANQKLFNYFLKRDGN